jgi:acyl-CoA thioesterase-1
MNRNDEAGSECESARLWLVLGLVLALAITGASGSVEAQVAAEVPEPVVLFLGDSLTAGFGLSESLAFPHHVDVELDRLDLPVRVVNAGVSGDTSAGGLGRLGWLLSMEPQVVVVELGANDGLRGLDLEMTEANLREIIRRCLDSGADVLLLGMRMPPNFGDYADRFEALFVRLAEEFSIAWVPFLLEGVGGHAELNLPDGMHPNEEGHRLLAATVVPVLAGILRDR